jgi:putative endonuclease
MQILTANYLNMELQNKSFFIYLCTSITVHTNRGLAEWFTPGRDGGLVPPRCSRGRHPGSCKGRIGKNRLDCEIKSAIMFFTYIIQSEKTGSYYYGHCRDLQARLDKHNEGKVRSTKSKRPWKLFYYEEFPTRSEAYRRELLFKSRKGYKYLRENGIIK